MDELMTQIKQYSRETLEQKFYNLIQKYVEEFNIDDYKYVRRLQYLNKNYTKNVTFYNTIIREYQTSQDKELGVYLQRHFERLEKMAQEKGDYPLWHKP